MPLDVYFSSGSLRLIMVASLLSFGSFPLCLTSFLCRREANAFGVHLTGIYVGSSSSSS